MRQYILPNNFKGESPFKLKGKDSQYFTRVLRLKKNDKILARDKNGLSYQLTVLEFDKSSCLLDVVKLKSGESFESTDELPSFVGDYPKLHLFQAVCKGKKNETIIKMATELGVSSITLVQSEHCIAKKESSNTDRYEAIVKEAIQQSGSPIMTQFNKITTFKDFVNCLNIPLLFFHQINIDEKVSLKEKLKDFDTSTPIGIFIGPEGGFSDKECKILLDKNCIPVMLKTNILRAETAAIVALSAIHTLLMEK
jgi:16S rRNA (uracil1498-N3)-methyltransferase